jgi:hypothetical protein
MQGVNAFHISLGQECNVGLNASSKTLATGVFFANTGIKCSSANGSGPLKDGRRKCNRHFWTRCRELGQDAESRETEISNNPS